MSLRQNFSRMNYEDAFLSNITTQSVHFKQSTQYFPDVETTDEAENILRDKPELKNILRQIVIELKKFYDKSFSLFLEDVYNPEECVATLSLLVITDDDADTAYEKMSRFKKTWWWDNMPLTNNMLTINSLSIK